MESEIQQKVEELKLQFGENAKYVALEVLDALKSVDFNDSLKTHNKIKM